MRWVLLFFISLAIAQKYAVNYRKRHCFTCIDGGTRDWVVFDTETALLKWSNKEYLLDYPEDRQVFKLEPIEMVKKDSGKKRIIQMPVDMEEPVLEWSIKNEL